MKTTDGKSSNTVEQPLAFGRALRDLRRARGFSQQALARRAGITNVTLSTWENGKAQPRLPELQTVLQALDATVSQRRTLLRLLEASRANRYLQRIEGAAVPSMGGDLLRAMRARANWNQAEAARAVGVHQAQIARWEQGESWPMTEKLHALCWALSATPEEVAALTTSFQGESVRLAKSSPYLLPGSADEGRWLLHLQWLMHEGTPPDALLDLTLLSVENCLGTLAERHEFAALLLPTAYAVHARHHLNRHRAQQAGFWGARGLSRVQAWHIDYLSRYGDIEASLWFGNVIAVASDAARNDSPAGMRRATRLLKKWLPSLTHPDNSHRMWGMSDLARLLAKLGQVEESLDWSAKASSPVHAKWEVDWTYRQRDHANILVKVGRYQDAWSVIDECRKQAHYSRGDYYARHYLLEAECLLGLSDRRSARERLVAAKHEVQDHALTHLQEKTERLAALLE